MTTTLRPLVADELDALIGCANLAFGEDAGGPEERALWLPGLEWERTLGCVDERGTVVGTAGIESRSMTVPGGLVPIAAVTTVSVRPSHRRQGLLTAMMTRQLNDVATAGTEALAVLWASEAAIYQRFGYGCAAWHASIEALSRSPFGPGGQATLARHTAPVEIVEAVEGASAVAALLAETAPEHPGTLIRPPHVSDMLVADLEVHRGGATKRRWVVTEGGAAHFRVRGRRDEHGSPANEVELGELVAATPEATAALWRWLLDLDLSATVTSRLRPLHDPLLLLVADPRRVRARVKEGLFVRLVDVPRALSERAYAAPCAVTLQVHDDLLPANDGCWRVAVDELGAATVAASDGDADLELDVADLGAAHLGATSLTWLAQAGRVVEHTPGALREASRAWAWDVPAFGTEVF